MIIRIIILILTYYYPVISCHQNYDSWMDIISYNNWLDIITSTL